MQYSKTRLPITAQAACDITEDRRTTGRNGAVPSIRRCLLGGGAGTPTQNLGITKPPLCAIELRPPNEKSRRLIPGGFFISGSARRACGVGGGHNYFGRDRTGRRTVATIISTGLLFDQREAPIGKLVKVIGKHSVSTALHKTRKRNERGGNGKLRNINY
jgi:hypothetical protein